MQSQRSQMHGAHDLGPLGQPVTADAFIADNDAVDSADDDDDDDNKKGHTKQGRRKIKIEFIADKSRRHITFSKRKAGIMKKAYELSTLTGTQVLLLVVSETGLVYTFTTAKLQPLVTQPEGKNLIQACLNAPGSLSSTAPASTSTSSASRTTGTTSGTSSSPTNMPGGLSIGNSSSPPKDDEENPEEEETSTQGTRAVTGDKRRRRASASAGSGPRTGNGPASPPATSSLTPPPLSIPGSQSTGSSSQASNTTSPATLSLNTNPTSPPQQHAQATSPPQAQYAAAGASGNSYPGHEMYASHGHMMPQPGYQYNPSGNSTTGTAPTQPLAGMPSGHGNHWTQQNQYRGGR